MDQPHNSTFEGQVARDNARQHNGNVYNANSHNITYQQILRQRRSDETLRPAERNDVLLKAAKEGQIWRVRYLIHRLGVDIDCCDGLGLTAVHNAAVAGFEDVVRELLQAGADVNAKTKSDNTPLHWAAAQGHLRVVQTLIEFRANVKIYQRMGQAPIHLAAQGGFEDIVRELLQAGADVNTKTRDDSTPLHWAAANGRLRVVKTLIEFQANVKIYDRAGSAPIHRAAKRGCEDIVRELLQAGNDVDARFFSRPVQNGRLRVVQVLVEHGADLNLGALDTQRRTALHMATDAGFEDIVRHLLKAGADVDSRDRSGKTPLYLAIQDDHLTVFQALIEFEAVSASDNRGTAALHKAIERGLEDVVRVLLKAGADVNAGNGFASTPLQVAVKSRHLGVVKTLIEFGADPRCGDFGDTALHIATGNGLEEITRVLLNAGANVNAYAYHRPDTYFNAFTSCAPLHVAAKTNKLRVANILLEFGAVVNIIDDDVKSGRTPLEIAASRGFAEFTKLLMEHGAEAVRMNRTALDLARAGLKQAETSRKQEYQEVIQILEEHASSFARPRTRHWL